MAGEIVAESGREPDELTGLEKLIPDVPGSQGRAIRGYEIFFHAASKRLFMHTYQGKQEIYWSGEAYLPYVLGCLGKLIGRLLKQQEIDEKHHRAQVDRINEAVADKLASLQQQNEAMILLLSQRSGAEEETKEELQGKLEAEKAARAADKAGFEAVIWELREEVAALKGRAK